MSLPPKANIFLVFLLSGMFCFNIDPGSTSPLSTKCISDSLPNKILIINSFDAMSMKARNNKKELFAELEDYGVRHDDQDIRNVTYRQTDGRFCVVDFELATILSETK